MARPKPDELYQCIESYVSAGEAETPSYARGLRLAGSHPAVKRHPQFWVPADTPDDDVRRARSKIYADAGAGPIPN
jgi:hypothetical protein